MNLLDKNLILPYNCIYTAKNYVMNGKIIIRGKALVGIIAYDNTIYSE